MLQSGVLDLLKELRPNAVAIVDAFDFPDAVLDSALGRWDGQVYAALYDFSLRSKLNEKQVLVGIHATMYLIQSGDGMDLEWEHINHCRAPRSSSCY